MTRLARPDAGRARESGRRRTWSCRGRPADTGSTARTMGRGAVRATVLVSRAEPAGSRRGVNPSITRFATCPGSGAFSQLSTGANSGRAGRARAAVGRRRVRIEYPAARTCAHEENVPGSTVNRLRRAVLSSTGEAPTAGALVCLTVYPCETCGASQGGDPRTREPLSRGSGGPARVLLLRLADSSGSRGLSGDACHVPRRPHSGQRMHAGLDARDSPKPVALVSGPAYTRWRDQ